MEPGEESKSTLEEARERLYSPHAAAREVRQALSESRVTQVPHAWAARVAPASHPHVRLALLFFLGALGFFVVAGGVAALLLFTGSTSVSTNNITLQIQGPTTIAAGDTVPLSLAITNKNVVALEDASLEVTFPPGTRSASDTSKNYPRYSETIGTIAPGTTILRSVKAVVFGSSGSTLSVPVSLTYSAPGSNSTFAKKSTYPLSITSAPLSLSVEGPAESTPGNPITISILVRSNATVALNNVVLAGQFPFGFVVNSSSVPMSGSSFLLGTLDPGSSRTITLTGVVAGQAGEQRAFHFMIGTANAATDTTPVLTYMTQDLAVTVAAPFLATSITINGDSSASPVLSPGATNSVQLAWRNTLSSPLTNARVSITLSGAYDPVSVRADRGFYDSSSHTITFDSTTDQSLSTLAPGASGLGSFTFDTLPTGGSRSPTVGFLVSIGGARVGQDNVPEEVHASLNVTASVRSAVSFSAQALHSSGPIVNIGPIPPRVGSPTTYSIIWQLSNPGNDVTNTLVSATLPSYANFTGTVSGGQVSYDAITRVVSWKPGDIAHGQSATVAFQVSLMPSTSQSGTTPTLTSAPAFTGFDRFAQVPVSASAGAPTTETKGDPGYTAANGTVQ